MQMPKRVYPECVCSIETRKVCARHQEHEGRRDYACPRTGRGGALLITVGVAWAWIIMGCSVNSCTAV